MITAEELLYNTLLKGIINRKGEDYSMKELYARELSRQIPSKNYGVDGHVMEDHDTVKAMLEFAKLHREAIIKEIAEDYLYYLEGDEGSEHLNKKKFFKEIYPLTNIK